MCDCFSVLSFVFVQAKSIDLNRKIGYYFSFSICQSHQNYINMLYTIKVSFQKKRYETRVMKLGQL